MDLDPDNPPAWLLLVDYWKGMSPEQVVAVADEKAARWRRFVEKHGDDPRIKQLERRPGDP